MTDKHPLVRPGTHGRKYIYSTELTAILHELVEEINRVAAAVRPRFPHTMISQYTENLLRHVQNNDHIFTRVELVRIGARAIMALGMLDDADKRYPINQLPEPEERTVIARLDGQIVFRAWVSGMDLEVSDLPGYLRIGDDGPIIEYDNITVEPVDDTDDCTCTRCLDAVP